MGVGERSGGDRANAISVVALFVEGRFEGKTGGGRRAGACAAARL
jgi:hypothetical protein